LSALTVKAEPATQVREPPGGFSRAALLFDLLVGVVQRYEPQVAAVLREERTTAGMPAALLARTLQAQGIWFQLLAIAEQNRDMRNRREVERERGYEQLRGTFASVFAAAAAEGITGAEIRQALSGIRVRPVITAHPTEAKRVTVSRRNGSSGRCPNWARRAAPGTPTRACRRMRRKHWRLSAPSPACAKRSTAKPSVR
jgi:phosphoenolpyruvate carboxylase